MELGATTQLSARYAYICLATDTKVPTKRLLGSRSRNR